MEKKETKQLLHSLIFMSAFFGIILLSRAHNHPSCEKYGYDDYSTTVMNYKTKQLIIQCIGEHREIKKR